jgi:hypothetical protein
VNDTWMKRCSMCGEYASGHGEMPELGAGWVCGVCIGEDPVTAGHVLTARSPHSSACHYVVVDLDLDRES